MAKKKSNQSLFAKKYTLSSSRLVIFALVFGALGALIAYQAHAAAPAGKGGNTGGSVGTGTIKLVMSSDQNGDGLPNWGDRITFAVSTTATSQPYVNLKCSVNGVLVATSTEGFFSGALDDGIFALYAPQWSSGPADCTATLQMNQTKGQTSTLVPITSINFHVNG